MTFAINVMRRPRRHRRGRQPQRKRSRPGPHAPRARRAPTSLAPRRPLPETPRCPHQAASTRALLTVHWARLKPGYPPTACHPPLQYRKFPARLAQASSLKPRIAPTIWPAQSSSSRPFPPPQTSHLQRLSVVSSRTRVSKARARP
jgi:hypothetical protein